MPPYCRYLLCFCSVSEHTTLSHCTVCFVSVSLSCMCTARFRFVLCPSSLWSRARAPIPPSPSTAAASAVRINTHIKMTPEANGVTLRQYEDNRPSPAAQATDDRLLTRVAPQPMPGLDTPPPPPPPALPPAEHVMSVIQQLLSGRADAADILATVASRQLGLEIQCLPGPAEHAARTPPRRADRRRPCGPA